MLSNYRPFSNAVWRIASDPANDHSNAILVILIDSELLAFKKYGYVYAEEEPTSTCAYVKQPPQTDRVIVP